MERRVYGIVEKSVIKVKTEGKKEETDKKGRKEVVGTVFERMKQRNG